MQNKALVEELHIMFYRQYLPLYFIDNSWDTDLADIHLINNFHKIHHFYIFSKYAVVILFKYNKGVVIT